MRDDGSHGCPGFTLYSSLFLGESRECGWTLVDACPLCSATIPTRIHLRSGPRFCHGFPYLSLMNFCHVFHLVKQPNTTIITITTPHSHLSSSLSLVLLLITTYHSLLFVSMLLFIIAFVVFRRSLYLSPFGNNISFTLCQALPSSHTTHTFFRNFTRTYISLPPAYLND